MVSRVAKDTIQSRLRGTIERVKIPAEKPYKQELADYFNNLLGRGEEAKKYWNVRKRKKENQKKKFNKFFLKEKIKEDLIRKFRPKCLSDAELDPNFNLSSALDLNVLIQR